MATQPSSLTERAALLTLASVATTGVAAWLLFVTATILPAHDPEHIPMWRGVAVSLCLYCVLSWACLATGGRRALLRWSLLAVSAGVIGLGLFEIVDMLRPAAGGHFEGYLLLMGLLVAGHGLAGILYALPAGRTVSPPATAATDR